MMVASTIVPVATFSPFDGQVPLHLVEQLLAQIVRLEQVTEAAHRGFVGRRLAAEIDVDKAPHRRRIVKCLLHRRVRQIEPLLQEIDAQHPLNPDRRAAVARLRIERLDQRAQRRPRHNALHLGKKCSPPRRFGVALKPHCRQRQLLHPPTQSSAPIHPFRHYTTFIAAALCRGSLSEEEFLSWQRAFETHGLAGLRATRVQQYRGSRPPRGPR